MPKNIYDDYLLELYNDESELGAKSGLAKIDEALGNFRKGRLITVFARSDVVLMKQRKIQTVLM